MKRELIALAEKIYAFYLDNYEVCTEKGPLTGSQAIKNYLTKVEKELNDDDYIFVEELVEELIGNKGRDCLNIRIVTDLDGNLSKEKLYWNSPSLNYEDAELTSGYDADSKQYVCVKLSRELGPIWAELSDAKIIREKQGCKLIEID